MHFFWPCNPRQCCNLKKTLKKVAQKLAQNVEKPLLSGNEKRKNRNYERAITNTTKPN